MSSHLQSRNVEFPRSPKSPLRLDPPRRITTTVDVRGLGDGEPLVDIHASVKAKINLIIVSPQISAVPVAHTCAGQTRRKHVSCNSDKAKRSSLSRVCQR
jgi:hypothetical protein